MQRPIVGIPIGRVEVDGDMVWNLYIDFYILRIPYDIKVKNIARRLHCIEYWNWASALGLNRLAL